MESHLQIDPTKDTKPNATYGEIRNNPHEKMPWEKARGPQYWEYRRKWELYPKAMYVSDFPLNLDIETTNACNLDCIMCSRTIQIARQTYGKIGLMSYDLYRRLIDEGAKEGLCAVKLNYLGEPLMHPDLTKQIRYAKDAGIIDTMFNTNATLLTEEKSHEILEAGIDNIFFSVDSPYREKYNAIRIGADFDTVVQNIIRFTEIKKAGPYQHVQTRVSMVVMNNDYKELEDFKNFWLNYVDAVGFGEYHAIDGTEGPYNPNFVCAQLFQRLFVMWDGICTPCCVDDKRGYIVGDANKQTIKEIWHGKPLQRLRELHKAGEYNRIDICRKCYVPLTRLDGTVLSFDDVKPEGILRHDDPNLELSNRARRRLQKSASTI